MSPEIRVIYTGKSCRQLIEEIEEKEPLRFLRSSFQTHPHRKVREDHHKHLHDHRVGKQVRNG